MMNDRSVRDYAVALDGLVMTFECGRAGHRYTTDFGKAKPAAPGRLWLARMLRYWGREGGGASAFKRAGGRTVRANGRMVRHCPRCRREKARKGD